MKLVFFLQTQQERCDSSSDSSSCLHRSCSRFHARYTANPKLSCSGTATMDVWKHKNFLQVILFEYWTLVVLPQNSLFCEKTSGFSYGILCMVSVFHHKPSTFKSYVESRKFPIYDLKLLVIAEKVLN